MVEEGRERERVDFNILVITEGHWVGGGEEREGERLVGVCGVIGVTYGGYLCLLYMDTLSFTDVFTAHCLSCHFLMSAGFSECERERISSVRKYSKVRDCWKCHAECQMDHIPFCEHLRHFVL